QPAGRGSNGILRDGSPRRPGVARHLALWITPPVRGRAAFCPMDHPSGWGSSDILPYGETPQAEDERQLAPWRHTPAGHLGRPDPALAYASPLPPSVFFSPVAFFSPSVAFSPAAF